MSTSRTSPTLIVASACFALLLSIVPSFASIATIPTCGEDGILDPPLEAPAGGTPRTQLSKLARVIVGLRFQRPLPKPTAKSIAKLQSRCLLQRLQ